MRFDAAGSACVLRTCWCDVSVFLVRFDAAGSACVLRTCWCDVSVFLVRFDAAGSACVLSSSAPLDHEAADTHELSVRVYAASVGARRKRQGECCSSETKLVTSHNVNAARARLNLSQATR